MAMTVTDPIADMLARLRGRSLRRTTFGGDAVLKLEGVAKILVQEGYVQVSSGRKQRSVRRRSSTLKHGPNWERSRSLACAA